ncbi:hypothetical protein [Mesorhizobium sp.]|uniref:hypothetical protein n=1 Tax=Mesorhizobium sp. TaxID=1871066 RepID=UPI000FE90C5A|nr:hypothetical protein [Mesorhizobium sp.]RWN33422.1 MAG: hypothetical protein EOR95_15860 [Mesorhizobium sp.]
MLLSTGQFFGQGSDNPTIYPLDGFSPTQAFSMSRDLLTAFSGSPRYTTSTGINAWKDQSGSARDVSQATGANQPAVSTAGPNSRECADFDGSNDSLVGVTALSSLITNSAGFYVASVIIDTFPTNSALSYQNSGILMDSGVFAGLTVRSNGGSPLVYAYNWDGNEDRAEASVAAATPYVLSWRHEGGNLYVGVNGVESAPTASGNTSTMTGTQRVGNSSGVTVFDGKIFEMASFSTVPSSGDRSAIIADFMAWIGA